MTHLRALLEDLLALPTPSVLATLVEVEGSSYRRPGARMLLHPDGSRSGLISAGCLETDLAERVTQVLDSDLPTVVTYDMGTELDLIWGTGMGCQGKARILLAPVCPAQTPIPWARRAYQALQERRQGVLLTCHGSEDPGKLGSVSWWDPEQPHPHLDETTQEAARKVLRTGRPESFQIREDLVLAEPVIPPPALWIFGAGEPARPLASMACTLGWDVGILDHRPALAQEGRFPRARWVCHGSCEDLLQRVEPSPRSAAVVMSHVYEADKEMLAGLAALPLPYLGLQGNRKRCAKLLEDLRQDGRMPSPPPHLHAPMGLDLGADSPESIAMSVLAEIQAVLGGHDARSLREGTGSIHR